MPLMIKIIPVESTKITINISTRVNPFFFIFFPQSKNQFRVYKDLKLLQIFFFESAF